MTPVIVAVPDLAAEPALVAGAPAAGVHLVRRCRDAVDLLAACAQHPGCAVVLGSGLPRLVPDLLDDLRGHVLVGLATSQEEGERLTALGVPRCVHLSPDAGEVDAAAAWATVLAVIRAAAATPVPAPAPRAMPSPVCAGDPHEDGPFSVEAPVATRGSLVAVWGPPGAPGRSTVAVGLAAALADTGRCVGLIDADTYAPSLDIDLALPAHTAGLQRACRRAEHLDGRAVRALCAPVDGRGDVRVLAGLDDPAHWSELREATLERVWQACRTAFDVTVVDVGAVLEAAQAGPRRNGVALSAVGAADLVLAVGAVDARGAARLVQAWPTLVHAVRPGTRPTIVVNRVPRGRRGPSAVRAWRQVVQAAGLPTDVLPVVPDDPRALARAWREGTTVVRTRRHASVARALRDLARIVESAAA